MNSFDVAAQFVSAEFPAASIAVVAGSTARGERTETSDIDLLLIGPDRMFHGSSSTAATFGFGGEVIEVFAYTPAAFEEWAEGGIAQFRPVIVEMLVHGEVLRDDGSLEPLRERWRAALFAGSSPSEEQLAMKRYVVTDVWDDLCDARDPLEERVLMSTLFREVAELALLTHGRWIGTGKYLARRLREWDQQRSEALALPYIAGDRDAFLAAAGRELTACGGRVQIGHTR
ncbi:MAG TPA: nucleotidyltransferase domain-containing protein [Candidatus Microbacterium pullistercoris]|nr:nucleotidyltransferase domain-containing protein [Candidatus Microbacterium pullistercoris]